jgi:hypothetical protein
MTREARIKLLRNEHGLSGTNWRRVAGKTTPLAQAFWRAKLELDNSAGSGFF